MRRVNYRRTVFLAYFHRFSPALSVIVFLIFFWKFQYQSITFYSFAACLLLYSVYNTVGCIKEWDHIYCSHQSTSHKRMTPYCIRFCEMTFSDKYGISIVFSVGAVVMILCGLFA